MDERVSVDVAVVGDGLIGLSSALHLQQSGRRIVVLGGPAAGRASTAAAGMLTPACEYDPWMCRQFLDLLKSGLSYYKTFLHSDWTTPEQVDYRSSEFTLTDLGESEESLRDRMDWMPGLGFDCDWWDTSEVCAREPHLSPTAVRGAIRIRNEAVVNPIALWEEMGRAMAARGGKTYSEGLVGVEEQGERVSLVTGGGVQVVADRVVLAAGAWTADVARLAGLEVPLCPAKGQMVLLRGTPHAIGSVVFMPTGGCGSIVERRPGSYVVGTSEEYLVPDEHNTAGVVGTVLSRLCGVVPDAAHWRIEGMWAGFRPMTSDELPVLGVADDRRFLVATGHHRNGILLAPLTGRLIADAVNGDVPFDGLDLSPFRYGRPLRPHARFAAKY
ncbi:NAD(P)/FAD-dependent oxidoreductase [Streptomyces varsoviensis]|nr:FAD-dependent oxidoreductase [Streptomyces varsoviensis]